MDMLLPNRISDTLASLWAKIRGTSGAAAPKAHKGHQARRDLANLSKVDQVFPYTLVDTAEGLRELVRYLSQFDECAMDTEADSMHHYSVKLCLIQISAGGHHWLVDPLCGVDLSPLWKCKAVQQLTFHGADYDLRMLGMTYGFWPKKIYDTMLAAKFLGEERLGLASLVETNFGRKLQKDNQKADWTLRPLPDHMCAYAAMDTVFLDEIRARQTKRLKEQGKLAWLEQTCAQLVEQSRTPRPVDPNEESWRIRGSNKLNGRELQLLRALWKWRESEAEKLDRPPYKVANPDLMLDIVSAASECAGEITPDHLPRLPRNFNGTRLETFLAALNDAMAAPESDWPKRIRTPFVAPPSPDANLMEQLRALRDSRATELGFDTAMLANRNQLIALAMPGKRNWPERFQNAGFLPWQCDVWLDILRSV